MKAWWEAVLLTASTAVTKTKNSQLGNPAEITNYEMYTRSKSKGHKRHFITATWIATALHHTTSYYQTKLLLISIWQKKTTNNPINFFILMQSNQAEKPMFISANSPTSHTNTSPACFSHSFFNIVDHIIISIIKCQVDCFFQNEKTIMFKGGMIAKSKELFFLHIHNSNFLPPKWKWITKTQGV